MEGYSSQNGMVTCMVEASDSYGASSSSTTSVMVKPTRSVMGMSMYISSISGLVETALSSDDADLLTQVIEGATISINAAECIGAPNCAKINREDCSIVANACGECLPGFVGASGHSNTLCRPTSSQSSRRLFPSYEHVKDKDFKYREGKFHLEANPDGAFCLRDSDCASLRCDRQVCQVLVFYFLLLCTSHIVLISNNRSYFLCLDCCQDLP